MTIKTILEKHKAYTFDLKLDLLRHFETLRNKIFTEFDKKKHANFKMHPDCVCVEITKGTFQVLPSCPIHKPMIR